MTAAELLKILESRRGDDQFAIGRNLVLCHKVAEFIEPNPLRVGDFAIVEVEWSLVVADVKAANQSNPRCFEGNRAAIDELAAYACFLEQFAVRRCLPVFANVTDTTEGQVPRSREDVLPVRTFVHE